MDTKKIVFSIFKTCIGIAIAMFLIMTLIKLSGQAYEFGYRIFAEEPMTPAPGLTISVAIVEGKSAMDIGQILEEKGLVRSAYLFYFQELLSDYHGRLQPGIYSLSTSMTPEEMMEIMSTVPEETEELTDIEESVNDSDEYLGTEEIGEYQEETVEDTEEDVTDAE